MKRTYFYIIIIICMTLFFSSCTKKPKEIKPLDLNKAHQKFVALCKKEFDLDVIVKPLKNTVWIYLPIEHEIIDFKATPGKTVDTKAANEKYTVNFLETTYQENSFHIDHDISMIKSYPKDLGYGSNFNENYNQKYRQLFSVIKEVYFETKKAEKINKRSTPGQFPVSYQITKKDEMIVNPLAPTFFILTITDIIRGVEIEFTINIKDYKKQTAGYLPPEEYNLRLIYEMRGDVAAVNDKTGEHLKIHEITMEDFLAKQITNRINFKYGRSDFPPSSDTTKEIMKQVYDTLTTYEFENFTSIELNDLRQETKLTIPKENLDQYKEQPLPEGGKMHVIKFDFGQ